MIYDKFSMPSCRSGVFYLEVFKKCVKGLFVLMLNFFPIFNFTYLFCYKLFITEFINILSKIVPLPPIVTISKVLRAS
jgi:hypothetical protein